MEQRFLTEDETRDARALMGWQFWAGPGILSLCCVGVGWLAWAGDDPVGIWVFVLLSAVTLISWTLQLRRYGKFTADIEHRSVQILEGAPERLWMARSGFCYLKLAGRTIKIPNDRFGELKDATTVKVAVLPTSNVAVRVDARRGIGLH